MMLFAIDTIYLLEVILLCNRLTLLLFYVTYIPVLWTIIHSIHSITMDRIQYYIQLTIIIE